MPPTPDNGLLRLGNSYRLSSLVAMRFSTQRDSLLYKRFTLKSTTTHTGAVNALVDACPALHVGGYALGMQKQLQ